MKISIVLFVMLTFASCNDFFNADTLPVELEVIDSGFHANYPEDGKEAEILIESLAEFKTIWEKLHANMNPLPNAPEIDFENVSAVLLITDGKPTGGYFIDDITLSKTSGTYVINYTENHPGAGCFTTQALTRPYALVKIPKLDEQLQFQKKIETKDCQ